MKEGLTQSLKATKKKIKKNVDLVECNNLNYLTTFSTRATCDISFIYDELAKSIIEWLSKNLHRQDKVFVQGRRHTYSMSSL